MMSGITIVCLTASNEKNNTCIRSFKRTTQTQIVYDSSPRHLAIADFNEDNLLDLVIANSGIDNIGIRLATGNGTFKDQIFYSTGNGSQPRWVAVKDFNNDHRLDIVVANYGTHNIGLLLGDGHGSFSNQIIFSLGASRPVSLDIGDFNNDSQWDIAVVNDGTFNLTILSGSGNGSFQIGFVQHMGYDSMPCSIAVADLNNDNRSDIVVVNCGTSEIVVLLSTDNANEHFKVNRYSTGTNSYPSSVTINYFNDDHYMDVAIVNSAAQNVGVFLGSAHGTLTLVQTISTGLKSHPKFIACGLFNNDTKYDLIVADSGQESVIIIFEGEGNGSFSLTTIESIGYSSDPCAIAIADLTQNNQSDAVVVNNGINNIAVFTAFHFYTTANQTIYSTGAVSWYNFVDVRDFNNDTFLDIVATNTYDGHFSVFLGLGNGDFESPRITLMRTLGEDAYPIGIGDFNKDKNLDIAVVLYSSSEIDIYFGDGNGYFQYQNTCSIGNDSQPYSIVIADFNNDQNLDMATANYNTNNVAVLLGNDNGTFSDAVFFSLTKNDYYPQYINVGDFNNDHFTDIVCANGGSATISILLADKNGSFQNATSIYIGDYPSALAIGDLNNDTHQDIVFTTFYPSLAILWGNRNGTFADLQILETDIGVQPQSIVLGDFNKDKILDIVVGDAADSTITMFFGTTNNSFIKQNSILLDGGGSPYSMAIGDFDNDKQLDIVAANIDDSDITVFLLKYEAAFEPPTSYRQGSAPHPYSITAGYFNNNNQLDIVVANAGQDTVQILTDYNNGSFMETIPYSTGDNSYPRYVVTGDFNRDNQLDIALVNQRNHTLMIILNPTNATFNRSILYSTGSKSFPNSLATGDLNKDGWTDIVVTNSNTGSVGVFLGFDYPTFTTDHYYQCERASFPTSIVVSDFNRDNRWDLAVTYQKAGLTVILLGNGDGTFTNASLTQTFYHSRTVSLTTGDFNNDGLVDIVVADFELSQICVLLGYGNGTFQSDICQSTGDLKPVFIAAGYINDDQIQDLVVANVDNDTVGILLGYGNGSFTDEILYSLTVGSTPVWIVIYDFNNDNISDLVVANRGRGNIGILLGNAEHTFTKMTTYSTGKKSSPSSIAIADLDNDKHVDIVVTNTGTKTIAILFGYGNGTFTLPITYVARLDSILSSIVVDDLNNDSILDIAVADFGNGKGNIGVYYGLGNRSFLTSKMYFTGLRTQISSIVVKDFDSDGRLDFAASLSRKDRISIMLRNQSEPFGQSTSFSTGIGSSPSAVAVEDLDKDGQLDIAISNYNTNNICLLFGYGNGSFMNCQNYSTGSYSNPNAITMGDIDDDTYVDIVVTNFNTSEILIFFGSGNRSFPLVKTYSTGYGSGCFFASIRDLNGDNRMDIVVANYGINTVLILYGSGNRRFSKSESYPFNYNYDPTSVVIGDLNNDGGFDISIVNYNSDNVDVLLHTC